MVDTAGGVDMASQAINSWVTQNGKTLTVPGSSSTLYDLSGA